MTQDKVGQIEALLKSIETGDPEPVSVVNEARYVQHNPQTHEGSEGLAALFKRLSRTEPKVNMVRGFEDGAFVFAHMEYDFSSRKICFEVFRFEDGKAVEHWDNIQERLGPNRSGRSMVDGATQILDEGQTEANRALVQDFVENVLIAKHIEQLIQFVDCNHYAEHNPHSGDGIDALKSMLEQAGPSGRAIDYRQLHRVLAQGNFVLSVCEGERNGEHSAFYDLYRIASGKIVEHWDTTEKIAPKSEWRNQNGKF